jgi:hypothetical protein
MSGGDAALARRFAPKVAPPLSSPLREVPSLDYPLRLRQPVRFA